MARPGGLTHRPLPQPTRVAETLLQQIRNGEYRVGDRLPSERALAEQFGLSRPVIREALRMLVMLQVVDVQVGRGAFVMADADTVPSLNDEGQRDLMDVVDVREVIETGALRLAVARATPPAKRAVRKAIASLEAAVASGEDTADIDRRLHAAIVEASRSPTLLSIWRNLEQEISQTIRLSPKGRAMSADILAQHKKLAAAVTDGELDEALEAATALHDDNRSFIRELKKARRAAAR